MKPYKHTQIGYVLIVALGAATLLIISLMFITEDFNPVAALVAGFLLLCLALFATLTVEVNDQAIELKFGMGLFRKRFLFREIKAQRAVRNPWYYGWGIHVIPHGWIFNVSGWEAVELQMQNGRTYRVGTDNVTDLVNAINVHMIKS